ncbi:MAG: rRNA ((1408)-N(1))-methyltransferase [Chloroflexota bacterium]|nr:rRNA ((1408)-N(1))-methyltransferase [Chloroflexota bacterium]
MVIDIGTGTGQTVLRRARREPHSLVIGVDAETSAMAEASRRAAANVKKGGLPNALFLAESAELLPGALAGCADLVTVVLPWGSLLLGALCADGAMIIALRGLLRADGEMLLFLSDLERTQVEGLATDYESAGLQMTELHPATTADVAALSSGWARRLGIPGSRPAWIIRLKKSVSP